MKIISEASIKKYSNNLSKERAQQVFNNFSIRSSSITGKAEEEKAFVVLRLAYLDSAELKLVIEAPTRSGGKNIVIDLKKIKVDGTLETILSIEKIKQYISIILDSAIKVDALNSSPENISISGNESQIVVTFL